MLALSASAAPSRGVLQPAGASFAAAFPSTPRVVTGATVLAIFPGALSAAEYFVSTDSQLRLAARDGTPALPSYIVTTATYSSSEAAEAFVAKLGRTRGSTPVLVQNVAGYQTMGPIPSPHGGKQARRDRGFESAVAVSTGDNVYLAFGFNRQKTAARAFTHSLQLMAASNGAPPVTSTGGYGAGGGQPAQGLYATTSPNTAYRDGRYAGYVLIGLLILAIGFKYLRKPRRSRPSYPGPAPYGGPPLPPGAPGAPGGPAANSQFAWMYQSPPVAATPMAPPPTGPPLSAAPPPPAEPYQYHPPAT
jgi:hypothetical protein